MASKQITKAVPFSFNVFTKHLTQFASTQADAAHMAAWLREHAPKLTKAEKIEADKAVIATLEAKFWLTATESTKVSLRRLSGFSFSKSGIEDAAVLRATSAANMALSRARDILEGTQGNKLAVAASLSATITKRLASNDEAKVAEAREACFAGLAALLKAGDADTAKRVRQLVLLATKKGL